MKRQHDGLGRAWVSILILFLMGNMGTGCDQLMDEVLNSGLNLSVEEPLFSANYMDTGTRYSIVEDVDFSGSGSADFGYAAFNVSDVYELMQVLRVGGGSLEGSIANTGDASIVMGLYFSNIAGLTNPESQASLVGHLTLLAGSTTVLDGMGGLDESAEDVLFLLLEFFSQNPGISTVHAYFTGIGGSAGISIESLALNLGAISEDAYAFSSDEIGQYSPDELNVNEAYMTGTITNSGTADVNIRLYIDSVDPGHLFIDFAVPPGVTTLTPDDRFYFISGGEARLNESIERLANESVDSIIYRLFMTSRVDLNVSANLMLNGEINVDL